MKQTLVQEIYGLDRRSLFVKQADGSAETTREALRAEYLLLCRLRGSGWQAPVAYYRFPHAEYMVTEAAPGKPISSIGKVSMQDLARILPPLLGAIRHLHALGYAHADLKPDHVVLDRSTEPWRITLIDLGSAVPFGTCPEVFTIGYSAPEAIRKDPVGPETDIYSLGVVLFFLLTGEDPYPGQDWGEILHRQFQTDAKLPRGTPQVLEALLAATFHVDAAYRPASVREVDRWLHQIWPRDHLGSREPSRITFPTPARAREEGKLRDNLEMLRTARSDATVQLPAWIRIQGERGIGSDRLATTLLDLAETFGWQVERRRSLEDTDASGETIGRIQPRRGAQTEHCVDVLRVRAMADSEDETEPSGDVLRIRTVSSSEDEDKAHDEAGASVRGGMHPGLTIHMAPLSTDVLEDLAGLHLDSDVLCRDLAELALGNPGLLAGMLSQIDSIDDLLNSAPIESPHRGSRGKTGPPPTWIRWAQELLHSLSDGAADNLVRRALLDSLLLPTRAASGTRRDPEASGTRRDPEASGTRRDPEASADEPVVIGGPVTGSPLEPELAFLVGRGMLSPDGRFRSAVWAETIVRASRERGQRIGDTLLREPRTEDPLAVTRLALLVDLRDHIARIIPTCIDQLLSEYRYFDAACVFCEAATQLPDPIPLFERTDLVSLTRVLSIRIEDTGVPPAVAVKAEQWCRTQPSEIRDAVRLLCAIGRAEREDTCKQELAGSRPTSSPVLDSWILYLLRDVKTRAEGAETVIGRPLSDEESVVESIWFVLWESVDAIKSPHPSWREPDDPDRITLVPPLERHYYQAASLLSWHRGDLARSLRYNVEARRCATDSMDHFLLHQLDQVQAAVAYENGPQGVCVRASWGALGLRGAKLPAQRRINAALAEFEYGRLGVVSRLIDSAREVLRARAVVDELTAYSNSNWLLSRLGQYDRMPQEPECELDEASRAVWLDAQACRHLSTGEFERGRTIYQGLLEIDSAGKDVRLEQLVDWILTELDLGHAEFAHGLLPHLLRFEQDASPRAKEKVRLASCTLELASAEKTADDLGPLILRNMKGIEERETRVHRWRAARNYAVLLSRRADPGAAAAWERANQHVQELLASCRNPREALAFRNTPAMRGFFRDFLGHGRVE